MDLQKINSDELIRMYHAAESDRVIFNNEQSARKIALNSLFGACGNPYFIFFDKRLAEAITLTGQGILMWLRERMNEYISKLTGVKDTWVVYADTDSIYINMSAIVEKFCKKNTDAEITDFLNKICEEAISPFIAKQCEALCELLNASEMSLSMKREAICKQAFWVARKKYALQVMDIEGVRYETPEIKIMGLESVRSDRSNHVRDSLEECIELMFTSDESGVRAKVKTIKTDFKKLDFEMIARPTGVNGIKKYQTTQEPGYILGTPYHVKAAIVYNRLLDKFKLNALYEKIKDGDKIKLLAMKKPNKEHVDMIAFIDKFPPEFGMNKYVDYDAQMVAFITPIANYMEAVGWNLVEVSTIDGLFE